MSIESLEAYKRKKGFCTSLIKIKVVDDDLIGKTLNIYNDDDELLYTGTIPASKIIKFITDETGYLTVEAVYSEGDVTRHFVAVSYYGTYKVEVSRTITYSFRIDKNDGNPATRVKYTGNSEGLTPAKMNYTTGEFEYGSFANAFFMPKPCMLTYGGVVSYYLDPNDYSKKLDGTASDYNNKAFNGNCMVEFPTVWLYSYEDTSYEYFFVSNRRVNASYEAYAHHDHYGNILDKIYMPAYNGSVVDGKLRSISGLAPLHSATASQEITYATANGSGWYTEVVADRMLVNTLLVLMGCSTDTQTVFGNGHYTGGSSASSLLNSGTMDNKGLFFGTNGTGSGVKVFGIENYWGNQWRRIAGWMNVSGTQKIKMTWGQEDGSTVDGYNTTGNGYIALANATPAGTSGGAINKCQVNKYGKFPYQASGSTSTNECDGLWFNNSQIDYAYVGGDSGRGLLVGAFCVYLSSAASDAYWNVGASLSYKSVGEAA